LADRRIIIQDEDFAAGENNLTHLRNDPLRLPFAEDGFSRDLRWRQIGPETLLGVGERIQPRCAQVELRDTADTP
jgi:hypothetical protein